MKSMTPGWIVDQDCIEIWDQEEYNHYKNKFVGLKIQNHIEIMKTLLPMSIGTKVIRDKIKYTLIIFGLLIEDGKLLGKENFKEVVDNKLKEFYFSKCEINLKKTIKCISEKLNMEIGFSPEDDEFQKKLKKDKLMNILSILQETKCYYKPKSMDFIIKALLMDYDVSESNLQIILDNPTTYKIPKSTYSPQKIDELVKKYIDEYNTEHESNYKVKYVDNYDQIVKEKTKKTSFEYYNLLGEKYIKLLDIEKIYKVTIQRNEGDTQRGTSWGEPFVANLVSWDHEDGYGFVVLGDDDEFLEDESLEDKDQLLVFDEERHAYIQNSSGDIDEEYTIINVIGVIDA
jgi:hypothetical protein